MKQFWQEVLPVDKYIVSAQGLIHDYDRKSLSFLYQPLIGALPYSLYMTLWSQLEENRLSSQQYSHHNLMTFTGLDLKSIYEARVKLEGIGLLKTYCQEDQNDRSFVYELQAPLSPEQFFLDGLLNVVLYSQIGGNQYNRLKDFFTDKNQVDQASVNITKPFDMVFSTSSLEYSKSRLAEEREAKDRRFISEQDPEAISLETIDFDFDLLKKTVNESLVPEEAFTREVESAISRLVFLYKIDVLQMANLLISAVDENNLIQIEDLRKAARDWYQFHNDSSLPILVDRVQPVIYRKQENELQTQEDQLINYLERTSPRQLLIDLSDGAEPSSADLKIVEDIMFNQKLTPGVTNVLIQYVMIKTNMKLTKAYVDKIASHWSRMKIHSVKEAMDLAKAEHRQYSEWALGQKEGQRRRKSTPKEQLPSWFKETEHKETASSIDKGFDIEAERERIRKRIKQFGGGSSEKG